MQNINEPVDETAIHVRMSSHLTQQDVRHSGRTLTYDNVSSQKENIPEYIQNILQQQQQTLLDVTQL